MSPEKPNEITRLTGAACERFAILLAANPRDEVRRTALLKEKEKIEKAQDRLEGLINRV